MSNSKDWLEEVWRIKEEISKHTEKMSFEEYIKYLRKLAKESEKELKEHKRHSRAKRNIQSI